MEKKVLFYTFIAVYAATAAVTFLGVTGVLAVKDNYLTGLVGTSLLETVVAVIAIFRKADFFPKEPDGLAASQKGLEDAKKAQEKAESQVADLQRELANVKTENQKLLQATAALTSLRLRVLAVLGARSENALGITNELGLGSRPVELSSVQAVIGQLENEREIEPDGTSGNYRRRRH